MVNQTLSKIYSLQQKHHVQDIRGLWKKNELGKLCQVVFEGDGKSSHKSNGLKSQKTAWKLAADLAKRRRDHSQKLTNELSARLVKLGMEHARFDFQLDADSSGAGWSRFLNPFVFTQRSRLFNALKWPLEARSRIMLVIKSTCKKRSLSNNDFR